MAGEEGVLYGDARHFYGGLEPAIMPSFTITKNSIDTPVMNCTTPGDTIIYEQTLCTVAGVKVVANLYHEPVDEFDGVEVADLLPDHTYENVQLEILNDPLVDIPTIFYKAFPYSTNNVFRRSSKNCQVFNPPPELISFTSTQSYNEEKTGFDVDLSMIFEPVITKVIVGRVPGEWTIEQLKEAKLTTPRAFEITFESIPEDGIALITDDTASEVEGEDTFTYVAFPIISNDVSFLDSVNIVQVTLIKATPPPLPKYVNVVSLDEVGRIRIDYDIDVPENSTRINAKCVFKKDSYPTSNTDGFLILQLTMYNDVVDRHFYHYTPAAAAVASLEPGETYYFRAFNFTVVTNPDTNETIEVYNNSNSDSTRCQFTMRKPSYVFGFDIDQVDPDPATRISYPEDVDNYGWDPVTSIGATDHNFGSWQNILGVNYGNNSLTTKYFMPRPCVVDRNGNVIEYLNSANILFKEDGVTTSTFTNTDSPDPQYNIMMEWPKIYIKRTIDSWSADYGGMTRYYRFRISDMKLTNDYYCICNENVNGKTTSHFYTGVFPLKFIDDIACSIYNNQPPYYTNNSIYKEKAEAHLTSDMLNAGYYVCDFLSQHMLVQDLLQMLSRRSDYPNIFQISHNTGDTLSFSPSHLIPTRIDLWPFYFSFISSKTIYNFKIFGMFYYCGYAYNLMEGFIFLPAQNDNQGVLRIKPVAGPKSPAGGTAIINPSMAPYGDANDNNVYVNWDGSSPYINPSYKNEQTSSIYQTIYYPISRSLNNKWYIYVQNTGLSPSANTYECFGTQTGNKKYYQSITDNGQILYGCGNISFHSSTTDRSLSFYKPSDSNVSKRYAISRICMIPTKSDYLYPDDVKATDPPIPPNDLLEEIS